MGENWLKHCLIQRPAVNFPNFVRSAGLAEILRPGDPGM